MKHSMKWWINTIAAAIFMVLVVIYLLIRPIIVQNLEPVLAEKLGDRVNGTLSWSSIDLDPNLDLSFAYLELKDEKGEDVLKTPSLTVGWSMSSLYNYLLNDAGIAAVIRDVTIEKPELSLSQKADGTWNVSDILKPSDDSDSGKFTGKVIITKGRALIKTNEAGQFDFTKVEGTFAWDKDAHIDGSLTGAIFDSSFDGRLKYTDSNNLEVNIKTDPIPLKSLQPLIEKLPQFQKKLTLQDGTGSITEAKIWKSDGIVAYRMTGSFNHAALGYENYILADGAAFFNIENNRADVTKISGTVNGQKISGEVHVDLAGEDTPFWGTAALSKVDIAKVVPDYEAKGIVTGDLSFSGTKEHPSVSGDISIVDGAYENLSVEKGKVSFSYDDGSITIPYLEADAAGGHILGHGSYSMDAGLFSIQAFVDHVSMDQIPAGQVLNGLVSGYCQAEGSYKDGILNLVRASANGEALNLDFNGLSAGNLQGFGNYRNGNWDGTLNGQNISYKGVFLNNIAASISEKDGVIDIPYASGISGNGAFFATGSYGGDLMNINVDASDIDMSMFTALTGEDIAGIASFKGNISGTLDQPEGNGTIRARNGHFRNAAFDTVDGSMALHDGKLNIPLLNVAGASGNHEVSGTIDIHNYDMNIKVKTDKARIENLLSIAGLDYPVTGWISNELTVTGKPENPKVQGDFHAWSGSVMGELFQSISGQYGYDNKKFDLKNCMGYMYDGVIVINGGAEENNLNLTVSMTDIDIERVLPDKGVKGKITLNGLVKGNFDSPDFDGTASSREITIAGNTIRNVSTGVHYKDQIVTVDEGSFHQKNGTFLWKGSYNLSSDALNGYLDFNGWNIRDIMAFFGRPDESVDGLVEGGMKISGTRDSPNVNFRAHILGGHLGNTALGEGNIDFSYMNGALSIRQFSIPVGDGILAAKGSMNGRGDLDIQAAARNMDISWIPQVIGRKDISIGGKLTAAVFLSGNKSAPEADVSVGLDHPKYGDIAFDSMSLMANASNNVITIQNALISRDAYRASMKGTMPGNIFTGSETDKAVPLDLDINLDEADLNMLALFFKPVTSASGPIQGHLKVAGSYKDPLLLGGVSVKDGEFTLLTLNEVVKPVNMNMEFNGNSAHVESSASIGNGAVTANGTVSWDHMKISQYNGDFHIHLPALDSQYYKGKVDGDFTLGEIAGLERPGIEGNLKIQDAVIDVPLALLSDSDTTPLDILTRINIQVGNNVRLYNSALYDLLVRGNISMMGPLSEPVMAGRVNVEKGTVKINTSEFKVDTANAIWGSEPGSFLPVVHAKAFTKVGHYSITAELDGLPGEMKTTFHSEPALNDSQILMLLVFHQNPKSDNDGAMEGALFNAGLTMLFGNGVQDFMKDKIGLDLISITSSLTDYYDNEKDNNDSYYYLKIGKYLFNDFMLTATMGMNNNETSYGAHYDLNSRTGISTWYNNKHDSYIGIDWSFKF